MPSVSPPPGPERVRLAVLGLGAVAQAVHLPLLDRLRDRFLVSAVADLSQVTLDAIGDRYRVPQARRTTSLDGLLGLQDIDALLVLTSGSHGEAILAGLERGLAVLAEKPVAWTLREADAIGARLAGASRPRLLVGYMKLYDPAVVAALAIASDAARVGGLRSIDVSVLHPTGERQLAHARLLPRPADVPAEVLERIHIGEAALREAAIGPAAAALGHLYTDVVLGSIVHDLALIRAFAGDPTSIDAVDVWPPDQWPPSVAVTGRLAAGGRFDIRWHYLADQPVYRERLRLVTERASIELEFPSPYLLHAPTDLRVTEADGDARLETARLSVAEAFEEELLAFHRLVVDGEAPKAGIVEGRADIVTAQRIVARRAGETGLAAVTEAGA